MTTTIHSFSIVIEGDSEDLADMSESLYECGCDDATVAASDGIVLVSFDRECATLSNAICTAIENIQKAGYSIKSIHLE